MAVPPLADTPMSVMLATVPPSTPTEPTVSPTPIALPALPPLFTSPRETAPPLALAVATPPLPALAVSVPPPPSVPLVPRKSPTKPIWIPPSTPKTRIVPGGSHADATYRHIPTIHKARYHRSRVLSMVATHAIGPERGTPSGI